MMVDRAQLFLLLLLLLPSSSSSSSLLSVRRRGSPMKPRLSVVVPHWPLDEEIDESLRVCLASLTSDCEKIVVVNQGTGFALNVNVGLRLVTGEYVAVVTNDSRVVEGDVYDLCVPARSRALSCWRSLASSTAVSTEPFGLRRAMSWIGWDFWMSGSRAPSSRTTITWRG
jgi:hypothetical protein